MPVVSRAYRRDLEYAEQCWQEFSYDDLVYVCYFMNSSSYAVAIDKDEVLKVKTLHVFVTPDTASIYCKDKPLCTAGVVKVGFLIEKLREVYSTEPDYQVRCVLTHSDEEGILYEVDVLWQLFTN